jgi:hypothetical protein
MAEKQEQWFISERSRWLALMHLSRRKDLGIKEVKDQGTGLTFMLSIPKANELPSVRQFGLVLSGTVEPVTEQQVNGLLQPTMTSFLSAGPFPYPVGLLHFTMQDDQGYFTWLAEPDVTDAGPRLLLHSEPHCRKFDRDLLDTIVRAVDQWYDLFFARIAVKAS